MDLGVGVINAGNCDIGTNSFHISSSAKQPSWYLWQSIPSLLVLSLGHRCKLDFQLFPLVPFFIVLMHRSIFAPSDDTIPPVVLKLRTIFMVIEAHNICLEHDLCWTKGLSSKFLFFHDKDLSVNVIKCLWIYDKSLKFVHVYLSILIHYNLYYNENSALECNFKGYWWNIKK